MARQNEIDDNASAANFIVIGIPALVIALATALYFFWPASGGINQAELTPPPATTRETPKANPDQMQITPESEIKVPPAAGPTATQDRDPRVDSRNAN